MSWRFMCLIPIEAFVFFDWPNLSSHTMALGLTLPLTEMSSRNFLGIRYGQYWSLSVSPGCVNRMSRKCGGLGVLQPYGIPWPVTRIVLHVFIFSMMNFITDNFETSLSNCYYTYYQTFWFLSSQNFVVRQSSQPDTMAISVRLPAGKGPYIEHYLIQAVDGELSLESSDNRFSNIPSLIAHYSQCWWVLHITLLKSSVLYHYIYLKYWNI